MSTKKSKILYTANAGVKGRVKFRYNPSTGGHDSFSVLFSKIRDPYYKETMEDSMLIMKRVRTNIVYMIALRKWTWKVFEKITETNGKKITHSTVFKFGEEPGYKSIQLSSLVFIARILKLHLIDLLYRDLEREGYSD